MIYYGHLMDFGLHYFQTHPNRHCVCCRSVIVANDEDTHQYKSQLVPVFLAGQLEDSSTMCPADEVRKDDKSSPLFCWRCLPPLASRTWWISTIRQGSCKALTTWKVWIDFNRLELFRPIDQSLGIRSATSATDLQAFDQLRSKDKAQRCQLGQKVMGVEHVKNWYRRIPQSLVVHSIV